MIVDGGTSSLFAFNLFSSAPSAAEYPEEAGLSAQALPSELRLSNFNKAVTALPCHGVMLRVLRVCAVEESRDAQMVLLCQTGRIRVVTLQGLLNPPKAVAATPARQASPMSAVPAGAGSERDRSSSVEPMRDRLFVKELLAQISDVEQQKRAREALARQRQRWLSATGYAFALSGGLKPATNESSSCRSLALTANLHASLDDCRCVAVAFPSPSVALALTNAPVHALVLTGN